MPESTALPPPPVLDKNDPLAHYWQKPVADVATVPSVPFPPGEAERHRIYSLLLMALVHYFWNGNKRGMDGEYPFRSSQKWTNHKGLYMGGPFNGSPIGQYLGHNIACLAVDGRGDIIDFDFNHNNIFGSSVEHAESRLVRRIFSLAQISDGSVSRRSMAEVKPVSTTLLTDVTIYTSLESCSQCSGIMALANVKEVVYLQKDFGMYCVGNILFNLTHGKQPHPSMPSPLPIPAKDFDLPYYDRLNDTYRDFVAKLQAGASFWTKPAGNGGPPSVDNTPSITSFLCTDAALEIFKAGSDELKNMQQATCPCDAPPAADSANPPLTNAQVLKHAKEFLDYAQRFGSRGTTHKL